MKTATRTLLCILFLSIAVAGGLVLATARPAAAQSGSGSCSDLINETSSSIVDSKCKYVTPGYACYAVTQVATKPNQAGFGGVGGKASLDQVDSITTSLPRGGALVLAGKPGKLVKMYVFGDTRTAPLSGKKTTNFTLTNGNGKPICDRTRSGMLLQSAGGSGEITVNNLRIRLGSTAYVVAGGDLLFDQDPRIDRRQGQRNPNAPLCSGFDSDCSFGDDGCTTKQRLVWGPYCREDRYPYIQPGLYRVSLDGEGAVRAGATDYELSGQQHFSLGSQKFDLPGAYTFCWPGWKAGSTGFETIVEPAAPGARVDHITLEYLGRSCKLPTAEANADNAPMAMMTVYNVEGQVQGGAVQGIGWALNEAYIYTKDGLLDNAGFLDYRMPVASDMPMIEPVMVQKINPNHRFGVKGVGEVSIVPPLAAVANAVSRAAGKRMPDLPLAPDRIWAAMRAG